MITGRTRGLVNLAFILVEEVTNLVERSHDAVVKRSVERFALIEPAKRSATVIADIQKTISRGVFESIRAVNGITCRAVNSAADKVEAGIDRTTPVNETAASHASRSIDQIQASLNGFWGDYLNRSSSPLDFGMTLQHQRCELSVTPSALESAFPSPTGRICVFVHGLAATESIWSLASEEYYGNPDVTFGARLSDDLGVTPIYLRYNTGRHISENGRALAALLSDVLQAYPLPVEEITLVGHSMGGLVARSAAHYARENNEPWAAHLRHVACIGSPHLGAPLEKAVNLLSGILRNTRAAGAQVSAELLDSRSAGVKDLRYGYTVDEEWAGKDPDELFADSRRDVPPVENVGYYFLAATVSHDAGHPLGQLVGDLMVRLPSASGRARDPVRSIPFSRGMALSGIHHLHLASHPDVYEVLRDLLTT